MPKLQKHHRFGQTGPGQEKIPTLHRQKFPKLHLTSPGVIFGAGKRCPRPENILDLARLAQAVKNCLNCMKKFPKLHLTSPGVIFGAGKGCPSPQKHPRFGQTGPGWTKFPKLHRKKILNGTSRVQGPFSVQGNGAQAPKAP